MITIHHWKTLFIVCGIVSVHNRKKRECVSLCHFNDKCFELFGLHCHENVTELRKFFVTPFRLDC